MRGATSWRRDFAGVRMPVGPVPLAIHGVLAQDGSVVNTVRTQADPVFCISTFSPLVSAEQRKRALLKTIEARCWILC